MKYRPIVGAALASAPLMLTGAASADFVGFNIVKKPVEGFEKWVALVVNLYAVLTCPEPPRRAGAPGRRRACPCWPKAARDEHGC